jgi:adenylate kinase family enzyme
MMKVINLFGGPGSGKSTLAAGLFERMKIQGLSVELVTEYAKDMVWERRGNILDDQLYILAKQHRRLPSPTARCSLA